VVNDRFQGKGVVGVDPERNLVFLFPAVVGLGIDSFKGKGKVVQA